MPAREKASCIRAKPPPLLPTMALAPAKTEPMAMLMTVISFSGCTTATPSSLSCAAR